MDLVLTFNGWCVIKPNQIRTKNQEAKIKGSDEQQH